VRARLFDQPCPVRRRNHKPAEWDDDWEYNNYVRWELLLFFGNRYSSWIKYRWAIEWILESGAVFGPFGRFHGGPAIRADLPARWPQNPLSLKATLTVGNYLPQPSDGILRTFANVCYSCFIIMMSNCHQTGDAHAFIVTLNCFAGAGASDND
jgi:hypothetical protein